MSEKIEGHVQFNGSRYVFFEALQPGLACEDPLNHSTCKAASDKRNAEITEAEQAERENKRQADAAEVEAAAKRKTEEDREALIRKAGVMKSDAKRIVGLAMVERQQKARDKAVADLAEAARIHDLAVVAANLALEKEVAEAQAVRDAEDKKIEAVDWIAEASK